MTHRADPPALRAGIGRLGPGLLWIAGALLIGAGAVRLWRTPATPAAAPGPAGLPRAVLLAPRPAWSAPLDRVDWRAAAAADHMRPDDPVVGLVAGARAWALPWFVLKNHHVANLVLAGQPILVTFCEVCSSAAAFRPVHHGRRLRFRLAGLYNGTILISDEASGSFWSPFTGAALSGSLAGARIERRPTYLCTWKEWVELHPATEVAYGAAALRAGHEADAQPGAAGIGFRFRDSLLRPPDRRLPHNQLVLGVESGRSARAYPLDQLERAGGVVMDTVGGRAIVALAKPGSWLAGAYLRRVDGIDLEFAPGPGGSIVDRDGGAWDYFGRCVSGPRAGRALTPLAAGVEEWYIWAAYHPATGIFGRP
jgi:hypothetical protein